VAGPTVAARIATWATARDIVQLPREVVAAARLHILDTLGVALAASTADFADEVGRAILAEERPGGPATVVGRADRVSARGAAIVNGTLVHGLDYDDTFMPGTLHPSASVLPAALAAAERFGAGPRDLLAAYVVGVEVAAALGQLVPRGALVARGFHPTGVIGCFASVVAAARVRRVGEGVLADALGVAGSLASGLLQVIQTGGTSKRVHAGWAAGSALTALDLAVEGMTGPRDVFEGELGFRAFQDAELDWDRFGLPEQVGWRLPSVSFKFFPACHYNHALVRCALALRDRIGDPGDVARIRVGLHAAQFPEVVEPVAHKRSPRTAYDAQFSAAFTVAAALVRGRFALTELTDQTLRDPAIRGLAARCDAEADPESRFPAAFSGTLRIELRDGTVLSHADGGGGVADPRSEVVRKFRENAGLVLDDEGVRALLAAVEGLEEAPNLSVLTSLLRGVVRAPGQPEAAGRSARTEAR
jgi:2-methylcitrate dehydratase PrpD